MGTFETIAQLAIALTGFTGVVVALGRRELSDWSPLEKFFLRALLYWSLGTAFLAFAPAALSGFAPSMAWRMAHSAFFIFHASVFAWYFLEVRRLATPATALTRPALARLSLVVGVGVLLAEASVALGLVLRAAPYLYLLALLWMLYLAAMMFIGLVFRQLWGGDDPAA